MMLQLLLLLAAFSVTQASFQCDDEATCLYHSRCKESPPDHDIVFVTMNLIELEKFQESNCSSEYSTTKLSVRPISKHKWDLTLMFFAANNHPEIRFGDALTVSTNQTYFKPSSDEDGSYNKISFPEKKGGSFLYSIEFSEKNLLDIFTGSNISYTEEAMKNRSTSSVQPLFWDRVLILTPCDASLIIDNCPKGSNNCRDPIIAKDTVSCKTDEGSLWFNDPTDTWQQLESVTCNNDTKEWVLTDKNKAVVMNDGNVTMRCAVVEPSVCDDSLIINDCPPEANDCTALDFKKDTVACEEKECNMWWLTADSLLEDKLTWKQLKTISCDQANKTWTFENEDGTFVEDTDEMKIRCSVKNPDEYTTTTTKSTTTSAESTTTTTNTTVSSEPTSASAEPTTTTAPQTDQRSDSANAILRLFIVPITFYFLM